MKFATPALIFVRDPQAAREFYEKVMGLRVTQDSGGNIVFEQALAVQRHSDGLVGVDCFGVSLETDGNELRFEDDDYDQFLEHLEQFDWLRYLHKSKEYSNGQRKVKFYDPDGNIIEVCEGLSNLFNRFRAQGMTVEQIAEKTQYSIKFIRRFIQNYVQ